MKILIVTPAERGSRQGNRITAVRWSRILRGLGHRVSLATHYAAQTCDLLVALHARRSAPAIRLFSTKYPDRPVVLALTGTDLYRDLPESLPAQESVRLAWRLVVLQSDASRHLPAAERRKTRVIYQSVMVAANARKPLEDVFEVAVVGHLREVKDPLRAAFAARLLPADSRIRVTHLGAAMEKSWARLAEQETRTNPRYQWLGEIPHPAALRILGRCKLLVVSSLMEGAPNAASEALHLNVPILCTRISGMIGLLGLKYPGYFEVQDTAELARLLYQAETNHRFLARLARSCQRARQLVTPERERESWRRLLAELER